MHTFCSLPWFHVHKKITGQVTQNSFILGRNYLLYNSFRVARITIVLGGEEAIGWGEGMGISKRCCLACA